MIFLFRIISDENPEFFRDLVASDSDTFLDFHKVLQKELGYDPNQLASFFITNQLWEKEHEITLIDMMQEPAIKATTMEEASLGEYIQELKQRMLYIFDFFSERAFFIELIEKADESSSRKTPFIGHSKGDPPAQLALDLMMDEETEAGETNLLDDPDNLRIEDLDPDMLEEGMPEDY
jgi:Plasmid pRiA4b ORF-3-like protein